MSDFKPGPDGLMHITKAAAEELDHGIEWTQFLKDQGTGASLTIVTHAFTVPIGINALTSGVVGSDTVVRLGGGTAGQSYVIDARVTLSNGERVARAFVVDVVARKS